MTEEGIAAQKPRTGPAPPRSAARGRVVHAGVLQVADASRARRDRCGRPVPRRRARDFRLPARRASGRPAPDPAPAVIGYAFSPRLLAHDPPPATCSRGPAVHARHRERRPGRARPRRRTSSSSAARLARALARIALAPAPEEALLAVHTAAYLERLRAACAGGPWDGGTRPSPPATWDAATLTVGGVLAAVDAVLDGRVRRALVHARPAGHHAEPDRAIASTYLNNLACGAEHARARGAARVAIVDWDVHVGNGAERIFWDRDDVLAISLHQRDWYPPTRRAHATGGPRARARRSTCRCRPRRRTRATCSRSTRSWRRRARASDPT